MRTSIMSSSGRRNPWRLEWREPGKTASVVDWTFYYPDSKLAQPTGALNVAVRLQSRVIMLFYRRPNVSATPILYRLTTS